jgi:hypothetical protein
MISHRHLAPLLLLATMTFACGAAPPAGGDEVTDDGAELKKKVSPQGTEGKFQLGKPAWATPAFDDGLTFAGNPIKLGVAVAKPPGTYPLALGASNQSIVVTAGASDTLVPAGLVVRYAQPVQAVWFARDQIVVQGPAAEYPRGHAIRQGATTVSLALRPGTYDVHSPSFSWSGSAAADALTDLVIPTASIALAFDPIDPTYPSASPDCLRLRTARNDYDVYPNYTASRWSVSPPIRDLAAGPVFVPAGNPVRLATAAASSDRSSTSDDLAVWPVSSGTTTTITINRLEVDDVAGPIPGAAKLKGSFNLELKRGSIWAAYECGRALPTHSGVDLPDGDYRVTTTADGPNGRITHVEEISFP